MFKSIISFVKGTNSVSYFNALESTTLDTLTGLLAASPIQTQEDTFWSKGEEPHRQTYVDNHGGYIADTVRTLPHRTNAFYWSLCCDVPVNAGKKGRPKDVLTLLGLVLAEKYPGAKIRSKSLVLNKAEDSATGADSLHCTLSFETDYAPATVHKQLNEREADLIQGVQEYILAEKVHFIPAGRPLK